MIQPLSFLVSIGFHGTLSSLSLFLKGYYATGTLVTVVALCRLESGLGKPQIVDILKVDLKSTAERIKNVVRFINLCSLMEPLTNKIGSRTVSEFVPIKR